MARTEWYIGHVPIFPCVEMADQYTVLRMKANTLLDSIRLVLPLAKLSDRRLLLDAIEQMRDRAADVEMFLIESLPKPEDKKG